MSPTPTVSLSKSFRIVGYFYEGSTLSEIQYDKLTHINYAFLLPRSDGSFEKLLNAALLEDIVKQAHLHDVKVLISVGGWGYHDAFTALAADPTDRARFVENLAAFVEENHLDGADIDWEYPRAGVSDQDFLRLIEELRTAMVGRLLTTAVVTHGTNAEGIPKETLDLFDFINIMVYDGSGPNHASMELAEKALDYWFARGLQAEKAVLGVPFYARPPGIPYWKLVQADPQAAYQDTFQYEDTLVNYNGIPTIQQKTKLALEQASGIMIWALNHDTADDLSLLSAIYQVVVEK